MLNELEYLDNLKKNGLGELGDPSMQVVVPSPMQGCNTDQVIALPVDRDGDEGEEEDDEDDEDFNGEEGVSPWGGKGAMRGSSP